MKLSRFKVFELNVVFEFKLFMLFFSSSESAVERATRKYMENPTSANYKIMVATRMRNEKKRG